MTLRAKLILIFLISFVLLLIAFGATRVITLFIQKPSEQQQTKSPQEQQTSTTTPPLEQLSFTDTQPQKPTTPISQPPPQQKKIQDAEASLLLIARNFAERFGSYSNQSEYENLQDLLPSMTIRMKRWAESKIRERQNGELPPLYHGITTRVFSHTLVSLDEKNGTAEFIINTQRYESVGSADNSKSYTQDVRIQLVKEDGIWLVDGAFWQK